MAGLLGRIRNAWKALRNGESAPVRVVEATEEEIYGSPVDWLRELSFRGMPLIPIWGPENRPEKNQTIRTLAMLDRARNESRLLAERNPNAAGLLDRIVDYVVGKGSSTDVHAPDEDDTPPKRLGARVKAVIERFRKRNVWHRREREMVRRLVVDGEFFLRFYPTPPDLSDLDACPVTAVRFVEPSAIRPPQGASDDGPWSWGVLTPAPEYDAESPAAYNVHDWRTGKDECVESCFVIHGKWNCLSSAKRGVPSLYACAGELDGAAKLRYASREGEKARSAIAYFRQHQTASESDIRAWQSAQAPASIRQSTLDGGTKEVPVETVTPGGVADVSEGFEVKPPPTANTQPAEGCVMQALEAVAARMGVPIWMVSGKNSDANFATSLTTESPFTRAIESFQSLVAEHSDDAQTKALEIAAEQGFLPDDVLERVDLLVSLTSPVTRNKKEETDRRKTLNEAGILSRGTWASEEGYDKDKETQQIKEEGPPPGKDAQGQGGGRPPGGGAGGPPPGGGGGGPPSDSPTPSGTPAARYAQFATALAEQAGIEFADALWVVIEAEERKVGETWKGPSGRWFTKNKSGRTVPASDPGRKDAAPEKAPPVPEAPADNEGAGRGFADADAANSWAEQHFSEWQVRLAPEERESVQSYLTPSYLKINGDLRGAGGDLSGMDEYDQARVEALDAAIAKSVLPEAVTAHRIVGPGVFPGDAGPGYEFTDHGFTSTTLSQGFAGELAEWRHKGGEHVRVQLEVPKGAKAAYVSLVGGRSGAELLLPRGSRFRVTKVQKEGGVTTLHVVVTGDSS